MYNKHNEWLFVFDQQHFSSFRPSKKGKIHLAKLINFQMKMTDKNKYTERKKITLDVSLVKTAPALSPSRKLQTPHNYLSLWGEKHIMLSMYQHDVR